MRTSLIVSAVAGLAASSALAQDFYSQSSFQAAAAGAGYSQQFVEDFQEATPGYFIVGIPDPLTQNVANPPYSLGLRYPVTVQSNLMGDGGKSLMPRGSNALAAVEGGGPFSATDSVVANYFVDGLDVIMLDGAARAVGFNPMVYSGGDTLKIQIFDTGNNLLGTFSSNANQNEKDFFGYVSATPIGRINLFGVNNNAEGADNIEEWSGVPAPGAAALLGLGGMIIGRRRRS